jgi:dihydrofolate reductase
VKELPGFTVCASVEEAAELAKDAERAMVIGGGSIYRQMLPYCDTAYITKVHVTPESDTFFPNLDEMDDWYLAETLMAGEENGIGYEMLLYKRK